MKKLKLFNGRPYEVLGHDNTRDLHLYIAAYSVADLQRLCLEAKLSKPSRYEIAVYWNKGTWGNPMIGVKPERGIWKVVGWNGKPERLFNGS